MKNSKFKCNVFKKIKKKKKKWKLKENGSLSR